MSNQESLEEKVRELELALIAYETGLDAARASLSDARNALEGRGRSACAREMRDQIRHQGACNTSEESLSRWAFAFDALVEELESLRRDYKTSLALEQALHDRALAAELRCTELEQEHAKP